MEVSGQLHAPATLPIAEEAEWAPEPVWTLWRGEKYFVPAGNRTAANQSVACRYVEWASLQFYRYLNPVP
jgi:hypothetical protein